MSKKETRFRDDFKEFKRDKKSKKSKRTEHKNKIKNGLFEEFDVYRNIERH